jgi:signal transduction histidine kinase
VAKGRTKAIRRRLITMSAASSCLALVLACLSFVAYDLFNFRQRLAKDLTSDAQVLAFNLTAPLLFDDPDEARRVLASMEAKPSVVNAVVSNKKGEVFAEYGEAMTEPLNAPGETADIQFGPNRLVLRMPILSEGALVGSIILVSSLDELATTLRRYLMLSCAILVLSLLAAVGISLFLQGPIVDPILRLTEAARQVSRNRDYSVRVEVPNEDELGLLSSTFNSMLEQIEAQSLELRTAVRMRDEFLSIASHELKTPLTPLQLHVQSLLRYAADQHEETLGPRLEIVDRQVRRLSKLVDDLLDISRLTVRKVELEYEDMDLSVLLHDVAERYQSEALRRGSAIDVQTPGPLPGRWDRSRLEQVIVNLISNALKYGAGKPVNLSALAQPDGTTLILVRDSGIGIRAEDAVRIFQRFERAVSDRHYGGFGLGLWIVRETLESMGGEVSVQSKEGDGATFIVALPSQPGQKAKAPLPGVDPLPAALGPA